MERHDQHSRPGHDQPDPVQAYQAAKLGMWLFLGTEVLLFGGLFCSYAVFKWRDYEVFHQSAKQLNWVLGAVNTIILLISSYFMALAVDAAQHGDNRRAVHRLDITVLFGLAFLLIKFVEYREKLQHGLFPPTNIYFGLYFTMTGLHGLHVIGGILLLLWLRLLAQRGYFSARYYTPVEMGGLYWHLIDVIWIYLFPLLYLIH